MVKVILYAFGFMIFLGACGKDKSTCTAGKRDGRMCTMEIKPVCGCNNKTYTNACEAEAVGISTYEEGECP